MDHGDVVAGESKPEGGRESVQNLRLVIITMNRDEWRRFFQQRNDLETGKIAKMKDRVCSGQRGQ